MQEPLRTRKGKMKAFIKKINHAEPIRFLLLCLVCLQSFYSLQAQEDFSWKARLISMSNNGRFLAVIYGEDGARIPGYKSGVWIYDLQNLLSAPQYLKATADHNGRMEFSPDSKYFAYGTYDWLKIFDTEDMEVILYLSSGVTPIRSDFGWISFSPDSKYIMSFSDWWTMEHEMSIWQIHTRQRLHAIAAPRSQQRIRYFWLSPDWKYFLDWSVSDSELIAIYGFDIEHGVNQPVGSIPKLNYDGTAFSPDGSLFASATLDGVVHIYDTGTWTRKHSAPLYDRACGQYAIRMAFDYSTSSLAAFCGVDRQLSVWELESDEIVFSADSGVGAPKFTANDAFLVSGRSFSNVPERFHILVWNLEQDHELTKYPGVNPELHPDGELMATIGPDSRVWIWNIKSKQLVVILPAPRRSIGNAQLQKEEKQ